MVGIPNKEIERTRRELLELHKKCLKDYLVGKDMKLKKRNKFFKLYDFFIYEDNIENFFFRPVHIFVYALVSNRLDEISDYTRKAGKYKLKTKKKRNARTKN